MTGGLLFGLLVFAFLAAAALFTLWLYPHLPERYRSAETTSNLRLGIGVIATITAVVLGLLISSVKGSFDRGSGDVQALAADLIVLDRTLRFYGPDAAHARDLLARNTERVLEGTWPANGQAPVVDDQVAEDLLNQTERAILSLQPDPQEPDFITAARDARWRGYALAVRSIRRIKEFTLVSNALMRSSSRSACSSRPASLPSSSSILAARVFSSVIIRRVTPETLFCTLSSRRPMNSGDTVSLISRVPSG
jgi:hypothetical protein